MAHYNDSPHVSHQHTYDQMYSVAAQQSYTMPTASPGQAGQMIQKPPQIYNSNTQYQAPTQETEMIYQNGIAVCERPVGNGNLFYADPVPQQENSNPGKGWKSDIGCVGKGVWAFLWGAILILLVGIGVMFACLWECTCGDNGDCDDCFGDRWRDN
jgi:hypothetical protein